MTKLLSKPEHPMAGQPWLPGEAVGRAAESYSGPRGRRGIAARQIVGLCERAFYPARALPA